MPTHDDTALRPARGDTIPGAFLSDNQPGPRYLIDYTAPDAQWFEVRANGIRIRTFYTGGVNRRSAIETAIGNVMDESEATDAALELFTGGSLPTYHNGATLLGRARAGIFEPADTTASPR
jgi:hypothetical protein